MASLNKVMLIGNLGKDPDFKVTAGGQQVASFSVATSEKWTDKSGAKKDRTDWHNIVLWGRLAEIANQYLKKGSSVYIEGRLQTRSWDDKDGNKRYTTEVVGNSMQMLGKREASVDAAEGAAPMPDETEAPQPTKVQDDLPF